MKHTVTCIKVSTSTCTRTVHVLVHNLDCFLRLFVAFLNSAMWSGCLKLGLVPFFNLLLKASTTSSAFIPLNNHCSSFASAFELTELQYSITAKESGNRSNSINMAAVMNIGSLLVLLYLRNASCWYAFTKMVLGDIELKASRTPSRNDFHCT